MKKLLYPTLLIILLVNYFCACAQKGKPIKLNPEKKRELLPGRQDKHGSFILGINGRRIIDSTASNFSYLFNIGHSSILYQSLLNFEVYGLYGYDAKKRHEVNLGLNIFCFLSRYNRFNDEENNLTFGSTLRLVTGFYGSYIVDNNQKKATLSSSTYGYRGTFLQNSHFSITV